MKLPHLRVGVPPGVGDVYWCLTKLRALAKGRRVTLCVRSSPYDRALEWPQMIDFAHSAEVVKFNPGEAEHSGYSGPRDGMDCILWPNAYIDRGERIETWLPELETDLSFHVEHPDMGTPRTIVYASSDAISDAWLEGRRGEFWDELIALLAEKFGRVTLVGAAWDASLRKSITSDVEDLVGKTTLPQLAGLLSNARLVAGIISGVTILANHFRTPCVAMYPKKRFPPTFPTAWVAGDAPYKAIKASGTVPADLVRLALAVAR